MGGAAEVKAHAASDESLLSFCRAVSGDVLLLASFHDREPDRAYLAGMRGSGIRDSLALELRSETGLKSLNLLAAVFDELGELDDALIDQLASDYATIYLNHGIQASPLESVWTDDEHLMCQESMFQVRAWYEHKGLRAPDWRKRPDDHLVHELQFIAHLLGTAESEESLRDLARFMDEHLLRWVTQFAQRVAARAATSYFAATANLTAAYCEELRELLVEILGEPRPSAEEVEEHLAKVFKSPEVEEMPVKFMPGMGPAV